MSGEGKPRARRRRAGSLSHGGKRVSLSLPALIRCRLPPTLLSLRICSRYGTPGRDTAPTPGGCLAGMLPFGHPRYLGLPSAFLPALCSRSGRRVPGALRCWFYVWCRGRAVPGTLPARGQIATGDSSPVGAGDASPRLPLASGLLGGCRDVSLINNFLNK